MDRLILFGAVLIASACDSTVIVRDDGTGAGGGGSGTSTSSSGSGATAVASTSAGWTVAPDRTFSYVDCDSQNAAPLLFVEIWADGVGCVANPGLTDVLVLGITGWDGQPGTFTVGVETPQGLAHATTTSLGPDPIPGTITVEPFVGTPGAIAWDLSIGAGRTDLSVCGQFEEYPCE
jgi:hypothetical protein